MSKKILIYGAYGYTGELVARRCAKRGLTPILAGRSAEKLAGIAKETGFETRVFGLDDSMALDHGLRGIQVVIHCAGPFSITSKPMVDACLRTRTHYLDITGELPIFEANAARSGEFEKAGIMVMPGTGFDVVPSDCLAAHLKRRLPEAERLHLAFRALGGGISHGTATTMVQNLGEGSAIRKDGRITPVRLGEMMRKVDFGRGARQCMAIPWGDVSTAYHSTGIPNIAVFVPVPKGMTLGVKAAGYLGPVLGAKPVKNLLQKRVDRGPAGPSEEERKNGGMILWGEVAGPNGQTHAARLNTPDGYTLTAITAVHIAEKVLRGEHPAGFQTPSMAYGADLIIEVDGVTRDDIA